MLIKAYFSEDIAHLSYLLIGKTGIFIIDPQRDISVYFEEINQRDLPIKGILLTHPHADFISGHRELQEKYKVPVYAHAEAPYNTSFVKINEGDEIKLDHIHIHVLETPGHTPFCNSFLVTDHSRGNDPVAVFTGDTLFVGDVGRPDLFPERKEELAEKLYHSLFDKLLKLKDFVEVYPAHASGSLCGKNLSEKRATTIGYEKRFNIRLKNKNKNEFIHEILADDLPVPEHFKHCARKNLNGPTLLSQINKPQSISYDNFIHKYNKKEYTIIDIRDFNQWNHFHVPGSLSIDIDCLAFANYAGWLIPQDKEIILIHSDNNNLEKAVKSLRKIGLDQPLYYLEKGIDSLIYQGFPLKRTETFTVHEIKEKAPHEKITLLDVGPGIEQLTQNIPYQHIPASLIFSEKFIPDKNKTYVVLCEKGALASLVISFLKGKGYKKINYLIGSGKALKNIL
jgi:glyoxylase-like metal-dependent hydrolase (beta-lactamase superfamily II)/rhodanese-related sulfurtransferase